MSKIAVEPIQHERFSVKIDDTSNGVKLVFSGDVDIADPSGILDPFFGKVHDEAVAKGLPEVVVDFTALNFLNSSGIKAVAKWVMKLGSAEKKYSIKIKHDTGKTWQSTSLPTLTYLVPGAVTIE